jgi:hypothetical protein
MKAKNGRKGFLGIDVDSLHHYYPAKQRGCSAFAHHPVWERAIPRFLELLDELKICATFFVVGEDMQKRLPRRRLREVAANGHEVASHTYSHPQSLAPLPKDAKQREILRSRDCLQQVTGEPVVGFRAPAWGIDEEALLILEKLGFWYDSSVMPCSALPLLKLAYWLKSKGTVKPGQLLGRWHHCLAPLDPYFPDRRRISRRGEGRILEMPVAVVPRCRLPFWHTIHQAAPSRHFFELSYRLVRRRLRSLHYQCHAIDLIDFERDPVPAQFRVMFGLNRPFKARKLFLKQVLRRLSQDYAMMPAREISILARAGREAGDIGLPQPTELAQP